VDAGEASATAEALVRTAPHAHGATERRMLIEVSRSRNGTHEEAREAHSGASVMVTSQMPSGAKGPSPQPIQRAQVSDGPAELCGW